MNEECKYCSYLKQCPDIVQHNSIYCICHKRIPKNRNMSYEQLQTNWNELKKWLEEVQINSPDIDEWTIMEVRSKMQELEKKK